jgi:hypothetical protein
MCSFNSSFLKHLRLEAQKFYGRFMVVKYFVLNTHKYFIFKVKSTVEDAIV